MTFAAVLVACASVKPAVYAQRAEVAVQTELADPVEGASVRVNGQAAGTTNSAGRLEVSVSGRAGDRFSIELACPEGYRPPIPESQSVFVTPTLRGPAPQFAFRCEWATKKVVVDVRAENGPDLPVRYLGREIGRTDAQGTARVTVETVPGDSFELVLDTTNANALHPQSPSLSFRVDGKASSFVFAQKFTVEKAKAAPKFRPPIPTNISTSNR